MRTGMKAAAIALAFEAALLVGAKTSNTKVVATPPPAHSQTILASSPVRCVNDGFWRARLCFEILGHGNFVNEFAGSLQNFNLHSRLGMVVTVVGPGYGHSQIVEAGPGQYEPWYTFVERPVHSGTYCAYFWWVYHSDKICAGVS